MELPCCGGGELFDHGQEQLAVAVVQVGGIPADLGEEAELVVGELLGLQLAAQGVFGKELAILARVSSEGTVCPFSTRDR